MKGMKESGVGWIGKIPNDWQVSRIKYACDSRSEKAWFNNEKDEYLGLENVVGFSDKIIKTDTTYSDGYYDIYKKGDVLFNKLRPYLGKVILASKDGFCTGEFIRLFNDRGDSRYLKYWMINEQFIAEVDNSTYGTKMPRANPQFIMNMAILIPPYEDQKRIADYLDSKCSETDNLIRDIRSQINALEQYRDSIITETVTKGIKEETGMKETGISWIGQMPKEWKLLKGKYMFALRNLRGNNIELQLLSPTQNYGVIPQATYEDLTGMNAVKLSENVDLSSLKTIHKGDFCISLRSFQGGFEYSEYEGVVSPAYQVFFPTIKIADGFYKYLFKEVGFIEKMNSYTMTLRDGKNIAFADFGNTYLPYPPYEDQQAIADYLDEKCNRINKIIAGKKQLLETLKRYKKALIFEYVTGKKEVPTV